MKVLHLINNLKREGAQIVVFNLITSTTEDHIQHVVCAREPGGQLQPNLEERGIPVYVPDQYYGAFATQRSLHFINQVIEKESIDIIQAHMADAALLGWLAARKHGLPWIIVHHGHDVLPVCGVLCRSVYYILLLAAAHHAERNVVVSSSVADPVLRKLALKSEQVSIITNGVPLPVEEVASQQHARMASELHIVSVGRLVDLKGQDQLISAAKILVEEYQNMRFYFVGDGPLREQLQQQVHSLGLSDNIIFTGSVDDVSIYLRMGDIYVSTSHYEGMPVAILEAMAWKVPVIASNVPGNCDVVEHGKTGLLYPLNDVDALVKMIKQVATTPKIAQEHASKAHQLVTEHYSAEASSQAYGRLYHEILGLKQ